MVPGFLLDGRSASARNHSKPIPKSPTKRNVRLRRRPGRGLAPGRAPLGMRRQQGIEAAQSITRGRSPSRYLEWHLSRQCRTTPRRHGLRCLAVTASGQVERSVEFYQRGGPLLPPIPPAPGCHRGGPSGGAGLGGSPSGSLHRAVIASGWPSASRSRNHGLARVNRARSVATEVRPG